MVLLQLEEQPPLIQSIFAGDVEKVKLLLSQNQRDALIEDVEKRTALHAAAFKGDSMIAAILLSHGARVNAKDNNWYTPLHRACCTGSVETVSLLLNHQADVSARDRLWQTPLHIAAANDAYQCVDQLLANIPNPNVTDRSGRTALHHAAFNGHTQVAELLIARGCAVNVCDKKDCRPLHCAAYMGHVDTMDLLLQHGADINARDRNQYTPLHVAAASGMASACRLLLSSGADVTVQNAYGNTPLHVACLNGHLSICQELIEYNGCDIEACNYRGQTPLHVAAASTHGVDCLTFLLEHGADINKQSTDGRTPLHMTAIHGRFTRSKMLIDKGATVDSVDKNGCTALHIAAQHGHELLSTTLLSFGADPTKRGYEGRTPLHMCCLSGHVECCRKFIQAGVDLNAQEDSGKTATHCAAYKGSIECLDLLVSSKADFLLKDHIGRLPLHYAVLDSHYQCVFTLVGIGSPVNETDIEGCSPLHLAAAYDFTGKCVEYLIQHKADPILKNQQGFTPVHYAVAGRNIQALRHLLSSISGKFTLYGSEMPLTTPIHLAAKNGSAEILRLIIPLFPDPNVKSIYGSTPLMVAAREGRTHCVQMLLRYAAKVAIADDVCGMTAIHLCAMYGHVHSLALLLDNTEDKTVIDRRDRLQRTALMLAVSGNHAECVSTLLKTGADPNLIDDGGHSALFRAVTLGHHATVQLLLSKGALVGLRDVNGKTVLHLAAACGNLECLKAIYAKMTEEEVKVLDNNECGVLHWACYTGNVKCVEYLLMQGLFEKLEGNCFSPVHCAAYSGSEKCLEVLCKRYGREIVKLCDSRQRTPLHVAASHGHADCVAFLLKEDANIMNSLDEEGRTPLIVAAQYGQSSVVELLLKHQVDVTICDRNKNTALHWACLKRHCHTALLLLKYANSVVNMANMEGKTPLHLAARNGLVQVTCKLLKTGASVLSVDSNGLTPALSCAPNLQVAQCLSLILKSYLQTNGKDCSVFKRTPSHFHFKRKLKSLTSVLSQTDPVIIENVLLQSKKSEIAITLHNSQSNINLCMKHNSIQCLDCEQQKRKCANCTLRKLMRQHITGKLKIEDLKSTLTKVCLDSDSVYKRTMIEALENFRGNIRERKRISGNRIENFIDAVTCNKSILLRRSRELCCERTKRLQQKPFDSVEELYFKSDMNKKRRCISMENVAVGPSFKIIESVNDEIPIKMNHIDQATDPIFSKNNLEIIKKELEEMECLEKLQEISRYIDNLLKTKSDMDVSYKKTCHSIIEVIEPQRQTEIFEYAPLQEVNVLTIEDGDYEDVKEEFVEAEECILKETKSLTAIKKTKFNKSKENSCLIS